MPAALLAFVAVLDADLVGWCWGYHLLRPDAGLILYIHDLEVDEEHRGLGVGRSLVEAFIAAGRARGAEKMFLFTADSNEGARHLYESLGGGPPSHGPVVCTGSSLDDGTAPRDSPGVRSLPVLPRNVPPLGERSGSPAVW
ncbi:MAG: GNAT family N-acetyltransferase [Acidimicrobiales bacterium]